MNKINIINEIQEPFIRMAKKCDENAENLIHDFMISYILDNSIKEAKQELELEKIKQLLKNLKL